MRRLTSLIATLGLIAGLLAVAPAAGAEVACSAASELEFVYLTTFKLDVELPKGPFKPGDTVPFPTTVTRPAEEDPLGQGVPMPRPYVEAAADVPVVIVAFAKDVLMIDYKITDANGKVPLALKLPKYTPAGPVAARIYAQKLLQDTNCLVFYEVGEVTMGHAFDVKR
ncbi:MAG TPA: hypothetical protein VG318_03265 [Actinomycetota bacterium]|nr:hypothetical protein [Actinomycetota bacterium]